MDSIASRVNEIKQKIQAAARNAGTEQVTLVAATKQNDAAAVREAIKAGVDACGENRVQEMLSKLEENAYEGAPLHFIGHLQTNKVKNVVGAVSLIQSVGSLHLAQAVSAQASRLGITQDVLLEVNIGLEEAKSGFSPDELPRAMESVYVLPGLCVRGLMAIPPATTIYCENRRYFAKMYQLFVDIKSKQYDNIVMEILSMGMSGDYLSAIAEGANMVRIGSSIFGPRSR